jgi:hypothetical protein
MTEASGHQVTQVLQAWSEGESTALEKVIPLVYQESHRMARRFMAHRRPGHTLQATALTHKANVRRVDSAQASFGNRAHFIAVGAQVMRRELSRETQSGA